MENLTSSAIISGAILTGAGGVWWAARLSITSLLSTLKELRNAIHELCLDVKEWSTVTKGISVRMEKAEKDIDEIQKGGYNGNYGSYPNKSPNGKK